MSMLTRPPCLVIPVELHRGLVVTLKVQPPVSFTVIRDGWRSGKQLFIAIPTPSHVVMPPICLVWSEWPGIRHH